MWTGKRILITGTTNLGDWENEPCALEKRIEVTGNTNTVNGKTNTGDWKNRTLCTGKTSHVYWKNEAW